MISSQAVLKKIYRKVAFSNLIISFGDSSPMLKSVEYIHKIIISFLNVPLDEMNYGVRHVKLFKI